MNLADLPVISDPWFYAVAVPAVVLMGMAKSGFGSGFGALATPLMALAVPVPQAAAIMLPLLMIMDAAGLRWLARHRDRELLRFLLPAGILGTVIGTALFRFTSAKMAAGVVGALTLAFLAQRLFFPPHPHAEPPPRWLGFVLGAMAGFTSFVSHAGSPPINAYALSLRLPVMVYTGTMAVFFAAINVAKWLPYAWLGLIDARNLVTSLALMPLAPLGVWMGMRMAERMRPENFYRLLVAGMFCTGCKLLWDGLR